MSQMIQFSSFLRPAAIMTSGIRWDEFEIALPSFLVVIGMPLTFNISYGIAFGFIFYPLVMIAAGRRKELNWMTDIASSILAAFPSLSPSNTLNLYTLFHLCFYKGESYAD